MTFGTTLVSPRIFTCYVWFSKSGPPNCTKCLIQFTRQCSWWWTGGTSETCRASKNVGKIKIICTNLCILLVLHIAIWCTVHKTLNPKYVVRLLSSEIWSRSALILAEQDMLSQLRERDRETPYVDRNKGQITSLMAVHLACEKKSVPHGSLQRFHTIRRIMGKSFCDWNEKILLAVPTVMSGDQRFVS